MFMLPNRASTARLPRLPAARVRAWMMGLIGLLVSIHASASMPACRNADAGMQNGEPVLAGEWQSFGGVALGCDGPVVTIAASADRSIIYLGGDFRTCGNVIAFNVVAFSPATGEFTALGDEQFNGVDGMVHELLVHNGELYVAGMFMNAGPLEEVGSIAKWDGNAWSRLGAGFRSGSYPGYALALVVHQGDLVVGGRFSHADNLPANHIARWDGQAWIPYIVNDSNGMNGQVNALATDQTRLYAGGVFKFAGGQAANTIAAWNGSAWESLGNGVDWGPPPQIDVLELHDGYLYAAGLFTTAGGVSTTGIARWSGSDWSSVGAPSHVWGIKHMRSVGDDLIVTGTFSLAGGVTTNGIARWDGVAWHAMGTGVRRGSEGVGLVVAVIGNDIYIGGGFTFIDDAAAVNVARHRDGRWEPIGISPGNGLHPESLGISPHWPLAMASFRGDLYVGGRTTVAGDKVVNDIARWDGRQWHALPGPAGIGVNGDVHAMLSWQNALWVAGKFTQAGGLPSPHIARWTGINWEPFIEDLELGGWASIGTLATDGADLFVGGSFDQIGGVQAWSVARWDGHAWHAMGDGVGQNGNVNQLLFHDGELYLAGSRALPSQTRENGVFRWAGSDWELLGSDFGQSSNVASIAMTQDGLFAGGDFAFWDAAWHISNIARWNGTTWQPVGDGLTSKIVALQPLGDGLVAAGRTIDTIAGEVHGYVGYWGPVAAGPDRAWMRLGESGEVMTLSDSANSAVQAMGVHAGQVFIAGNFSMLRKHDVDEVSKQIARFAPNDLFTDGFESH